MFLKLFSPLLISLLGILSFIYLPSGKILIEGLSLGNISMVVFWFGNTLLLHKIVLIFIVNGFLTSKRNIEIPQLLQSVIGIILWFLSFLLFFTIYFKYNLTGVWATSSIAIAILGFSVRAMLMDFFSGLAMTIERPFVTGDWVRTDDGSIGKIDSMNWRVTKIVTADNFIKVIPNSILSTEPFFNLGQTMPIREKIEIELEYDIPTEKIERVLKSAANLVCTPLKNYAEPDTRIKEFTTRGVIWQLRFWLKDMNNKDEVVYNIKKNIIKSLHYSGVKTPRNKIDIIHAENPIGYVRDDITFLLKEISFFNVLTDEEFQQLSKASIEQEIKKGENVIEYGSEGDSLFLLLEGTLSVHILNEKNESKEVAKIAPGEFFGEMSLLTGAPRSANIIADINSVVFEIKQEHLKPILHNREEIMESFIEYLQKRRLLNQQNILKNENQESKQEEKKNFLNKLKKVFSL